MRTILDFERPVGELEKKLEELRALETAGEGASIGDEISRLEGKASQALEDLYGNLTPWQKTQVARHPERPHFSDYASRLFTEFTPFAGIENSPRMPRSRAASRAFAAKRFA